MVMSTARRTIPVGDICRRPQVGKGYRGSKRRNVCRKAYRRGRASKIHRRLFRRRKKQSRDQCMESVAFITLHVHAAHPCRREANPGMASRKPTQLRHTACDCIQRHGWNACIVWPISSYDLARSENPIELDRTVSGGWLMPSGPTIHVETGESHKAII